MLFGLTIDQWITVGSYIAQLIAIIVPLLV